MAKTQRVIDAPPKRGRPASATLDATVAEVRRLRKLGKTYAQIGEVMGFTRQATSYYIKKLPEHVCPCCGFDRHRAKKQPQPKK